MGFISSWKLLRQGQRALKSGDMSKLPEKAKKDIRKFVCNNPEFKKYSKEEQEKALKHYGL